MLYYTTIRESCPSLLTLDDETVIEGFYDKKALKV